MDLRVRVLPKPIGASLALLCALLVVSGCKKQSAASPGGSTTPASAEVPMSSGSYGGVTFQYPSDWKLQKRSENGVEGIEVTAPTDDGDWRPYVFFEIVDAPGSYDLAELLDQAGNALQARKVGFHLNDSRVVNHPNGYRLGRLDYNATAEQAGTALTWQQLLIPLPGQKKRLIVSASAAKDTWSKYQPIFEKIEDSIQLPKAGG